MDLKIIWSSAHFSTNKAYHHDITEILLKVALNTIILILFRLSVLLEEETRIPRQEPPISRKSLTNFITSMLYRMSIQYHVIKFVSDLRQVCGFLWVPWFPPPIKLKATIKLKYC